MDYTLALLNFVHLVATYGLVGGIMFIRFVSTPVMRGLEPTTPVAGTLLFEGTNRLIKFVWFYIALSIITGIPMMLMNRDFQGLGSTNNTWSTAILAKHALIIAMLIAIMVQTLTVRSIQRLRKESQPRDAEGKPSASDMLKRLGSRMDRLALSYAILGILVLGLTSVTATQKFHYSTLINFAHILLTVAWIGGLMFLVFVGVPIISKNLKTMGVLDAVEHMLAVGKKFIIILWTALIFAIATGIPLMLSNSQYRGLLKIDDLWSGAMFAKHVAFVGMILGAISITRTIVTTNKLCKAAHLAKPSEEMLAEIDKRRRTIVAMGKLGFAVASIVLLCTAIVSSMMKAQ